MFIYFNNRHRRGRVFIPLGKHHTCYHAARSAHRIAPGCKTMPGDLSDLLIWLAGIGTVEGYSP